MHDVATDQATEPAVVLPGGRPPGGPDRVVPRGRHGIPREEVALIQRARVIDAFVDEIGRSGLEGAHVSGVCAAAGVSTKEFYALFDSKNHCFNEAFDAGAELVCARGAAAYRQASGCWEHRLREAIYAMLEILAANPAFCRLCVVEAPRAGPESRRHLDAVVRYCRQAFGGERTTDPPPGLSTDSYESSLVGSVVAPLADYVNAGKADRLTELASVVTYSLALHVVGRERAMRELRLAEG